MEDRKAALFKGEQGRYRGLHHIGTAEADKVDAGEEHPCVIGQKEGPVIGEVRPRSLGVAQGSEQEGEIHLAACGTLCPKL